MRHFFAGAVVLSLIGMVLPLSTVASDTGQPGVPASDETIGDHTRDWLDLQRQGQQASKTDQNLAPAVEDRIYQRYLDSFEYPIPENFYSRDSFREGN